MTDDLSQDLIELLGEDGFFALTEAYAGVRLFVPQSVERSEMVQVLGDGFTRALSKAYGASYIRVPLARTFRARRYRDANMSNRDIAVRLGITENAVEKLFIREKRGGREMISARNPNLQLDLFKS